MWVVDHLLQADPNAAPDQRDMLEAYTTLGYLAAHTERVRLGTMVTGVTFRPPALLVKAVTTLDVLTGDQAPFDGTYYRLRRPLGIPGPAHRPHPPILIGGWGRTPDPAAGRAVRRCVAAAALGIKHWWSAKPSVDGGSAGHTGCGHPHAPRGPSTLTAGMPRKHDPHRGRKEHQQ